MAKTNLFMTVGLPRSGKSTWAREQSQRHGIAVVCADAIRMALHGRAFFEPAEPMVWAMARVMVDSLFKAGAANVILDCTNLESNKRKIWGNGDWRVVPVFVLTDAETCRRRCYDTGKPELVGVIDIMYADYIMTCSSVRNGFSPDQAMLVSSPADFAFGGVEADIGDWIRRNG